MTEYLALFPPAGLKTAVVLSNQAAKQKQIMVLSIPSPPPKSEKPSWWASVELKCVSALCFRVCICVLWKRNAHSQILLCVHISPVWNWFLHAKVVRLIKNHTNSYLCAVQRAVNVVIFSIQHDWAAGCNIDLIEVVQNHYRCFLGQKCKLSKSKDADILGDWAQLLSKYWKWLCNPPGFLLNHLRFLSHAVFWDCQHSTPTQVSPALSKSLRGWIATLD